MPRNDQEPNKNSRESIALNVERFDDPDGTGNGTPSDTHPLDIVSRSFYRLGEKTTACLLKCRCDLEITGLSACVNAENYNLELGKQYAMDDAMSTHQEYVGVMNHV